eukprot:gene15648-17227_t
MSQQKKTSSNPLLKSYTRRLKEDVRMMLDNFVAMLKLVKIEEESQVARLSQSVQMQYEIDVRASNIVIAGESLMKLVSDMKEFLILNDFTSVNTSISQSLAKLREIDNLTEEGLCALKDSLSSDLLDIEKKQFSS